MGERKEGRGREAAWVKEEGEKEHPTKEREREREGIPRITSADGSILTVVMEALSVYKTSALMHRWISTVLSEEHEVSVLI